MDLVNLVIGGGSAQQGNTGQPKVPSAERTRRINLMYVLGISIVLNLYSIKFLGSMNINITSKDLHGLDGIFLPLTNFSEQNHYPLDDALNAKILTNSSESSVDPIEAIMIIATVPFDAAHAMAVWTHLECVTNGIDRVIISAPDAPWSRDVITKIMNEFQKRRNHTTFQLEAAYYTNNRYDAGLWCDGLTHHLGFDGQDFTEKESYNSSRSTSDTKSPAIFLINDSVISLVTYDSLTNKILANAQIEQKQKRDPTSSEDDHLKLVSLNGILASRRKGDDRSFGWVESVYRGLTPDGVVKFYKHSCVNMGVWCRNTRGDGRKRCIVDRYEKSLTDAFVAREVDAMFPSKLPKDWDAMYWVERHNVRFNPDQLWIRGEAFFHYLVEEYNFPVRKTKKAWELKSQCLKLIDGNVTWFRELPFPSAEILGKFQADMLESANNLT